MSDTSPSTSDNTSEIRSARSILTLVLFVLTNIIVLFPFHIPIPIPTFLIDFSIKSLEVLRIIPLRQKQELKTKPRFKTIRIPFNFVTAPLLADLILLATLSIGRQEVHDGTVGASTLR